MESEDELPSLSSTARARRALTLIVMSILALTFAGLGYLHPNFGLGLRAASPPASYQLAAVDFVTPTTGWVVVERRAHDFALLRTTDAGDTWTRQLAGSTGIIGEYVRFFDPAHGVLVLLGQEAVLYQTGDGGRTWSRHALTQYGGYIWSADFVDANHGWLLAQDPTEGQALLRTEDGGRTWVGLGNPVLFSDWAYRVLFANTRDGWLYSQSIEPYAYKSEDGGTSWHRVPLPAPVGGWPAAQGGSISAGEFFVAAQPTQGAGVTTTVVGIAPPNGRSPAGGIFVGYPPLRVDSWDGGRPVTYIYADVSPYRYSSVEHVNPGPFVDTQPTNQYHMSSVDGGRSWKPILTPSISGAVGYVDALNWWWIGSGVRSTSADAGRTWTRPRSMAVPEPLGGTLQFTDSTHAWFGAMAGPRPLVETTEDGGINWRMILLPAIPPTQAVASTLHALT
jgi:photosystem II stability/assembly factor-like uncharacterized protein